MGIKPLVLAETDDKLAFASELPSLFESDIDLGGIDRDALAQYFAFGYIPAPKTAFRNVSKVRPGERILISDEVSTATNTTSHRSRLVIPTLIPLPLTYARSSNRRSKNA
nr:hypothetical protein [Haloarcula sp. CBA1131]